MGQPQNEKEGLVGDVSTGRWLSLRYDVGMKYDEFEDSILHSECLGFTIRWLKDAAISQRMMEACV